MALSAYEELSPAKQKEATLLIDGIKPIKGYVRTVTYCRECDVVYARRFIPFGLGRGQSWNLCSCLLTGNETHGSRVEVLRREP